MKSSTAVGGDHSRVPEPVKPEPVDRRGPRPSWPLTSDIDPVIARMVGPDRAVDEGMRWVSVRRLARFQDQFLQLEDLRAGLAGFLDEMNPVVDGQFLAPSCPKTKANEISTSSPITTVRADREILDRSPPAFFRKLNSAKARRSPFLISDRAACLAIHAVRGSEVPGRQPVQHQVRMVLGDVVQVDWRPTCGRRRRDRGSAHPGSAAPGAGPRSAGSG